MEFPSDLPHVLHYRLPSKYRVPGTYDCGVTVRVTMPRRAVRFISTSGVSNAPETCPTIPPGADAWRLAGGDWQPMSAIPPEWMPFLERRRGSEMDPRK
jgi:hypothetical protein